MKESTKKKFEIKKRFGNTSIGIVSNWNSRRTL